MTTQDSRQDIDFSADIDLPCDIAPFVPHQRGMCLLSRILEVDEESLRAEVIPTQDDPFATARGIPGWVGLEWMAQAIAAWAGVCDRGSKSQPSIGMLLGTRRYRVEPPFFAFNVPVHVHILLSFRADNGLGAFEATLETPTGAVLASGTLNVFQPTSMEMMDAMKRGNVQ